MTCVDVERGESYLKVVVPSLIDFVRYYDDRTTVPAIFEIQGKPFNVELKEAYFLDLSQMGMESRFLVIPKMFERKCADCSVSKIHFEAMLYGPDFIRAHGKISFLFQSPTEKRRIQSKIKCALEETR